MIKAILAILGFFVFGYFTWKYEEKVKAEMLKRMTKYRN